MTPWVLRLVLLNAAMYVMTMAAPGFMSSLTLVPAWILQRPWTIITYMFLHGSTGHIFFNMLSLYFFGPRLESELGSRNFLLLYLVSGVAGALLCFVFTPDVAIVGASGAVYGVTLGFAYFWPREKIYIWGAFPIESRILVLIMTALSLFGGVGPASDGIAHFAHLGGFLGGFLFLRFRGKRPPHDQRKSPEISPPRSSDILRWKRIDRTRLHEVNREEYDRIIGKMTTLGVGSLSEIERTFLDRFSAD